MFILLLAVSIFLIILGIILEENLYNDDIGYSCKIIGGLGSMIAIVGMLVMVACYIDACRAEDKIAMYQEENKKIEEKIEVTVKQYMNFEKDTYKELKVDSYINLVSLYPDLKSDKLIKEQIKTYQKNSEKIIELKETKINKKTYKWWLNFGG
jgi:Zn ribbon nucleic-acid-binding protein